LFANKYVSTINILRWLEPLNKQTFVREKIRSTNDIALTKQIHKGTTRRDVILCFHNLNQVYELFDIYTSGCTRNMTAVHNLPAHFRATKHPHHSKGQTCVT